MLNAGICGLPQGFGFRVRFYQTAVLDLLRFFHGHYGSPISSRERDADKLTRLRSDPSLFLTAHFHNWELMGAWMMRQGIPLVSAARPMADGFSQSLLIRLRNRLGMNILFGEIPRRALRHVRGGGCFGLLWDQRIPASAFGSGAANPTRAPLFGRSLSLDPLPRFLVRHAALPVYFGMLLPGGRFRVIQLAGPRSPAKLHPVPDPDSGSGIPYLPSQPPAPGLDPRTPLSSQEKIGDPWRVQGYRLNEADRLARRYHRVLECLVRAYPTYWYGLAHRRFLT